MSSPLPVNAKRDSDGDHASSHINENVLAGSFNRAESTARLSSSPMPPSSQFLSTSPARSTHSHTGYGSTQHGDHLSVNRPHSNYGDNLSVDLPDEEVAKAVKRHLVSHSPSGSTSYLNSSPRRSVNSRYSDDDGEHTNVHQLPGGAITHDIYKWTESVEQDKKARMKRSRSMLVSRHEPSDPALVNLKDPGGFRRHYIINRAAKKGRKPPSWITHTFVDFLALYGHFGGEDLSDDEGEESDDEEWDEIVGEGEDAEERRALLRQAQRESVEGTATPSKAVFLLLKSFIGTGKIEYSIVFVPFYTKQTLYLGVMFLPKA